MQRLELSLQALGRYRNPVTFRIGWHWWRAMAAMERNTARRSAREGRPMRHSGNARTRQPCSPTVRWISHAVSPPRQARRPPRVRCWWQCTARGRARAVACRCPGRGRCRGCAGPCHGAGWGGQRGVTQSGRGRAAPHRSHAGAGDGVCRREELRRRRIWQPRFAPRASRALRPPLIYRCRLGLAGCRARAASAHVGGPATATSAQRGLLADSSVGRCCIPRRLGRGSATTIRRHCWSMGV